MNSSALLTPRRPRTRSASATALKHWILAGRIRTVKTPGGHHRVPSKRSRSSCPPQTLTPAQAHQRRNQLIGSILRSHHRCLLAKVVLAVGNQRVTAIITADAVRELALKPGEQAVALVKATEVMIGPPLTQVHSALSPGRLKSVVGRSAGEPATGTHRLGPPLLSRGVSFAESLC